MATGLQSLVECGTKLWLDSIDPDFLRVNSERGATGATSNPIIVADIIRSGRFDSELASFAERGLNDEPLDCCIVRLIPLQNPSRKSRFMFA